VIKYLLFFVFLLFTTPNQADDADQQAREILGNIFGDIIQSPGQETEPPPQKSEDELWEGILNEVLDGDYFQPPSNDYSGSDWHDQDNSYRPGHAAYVHNSLASVTEDRKIKITGDQANIRIGPSTEFQVLAVGRKDQTFPFVSTIGEWFEISLDVTATPENTTSLGKWGTVKVNTNLNFRSAPWGSVIGKFQNGAQLEILQQEGEWYQIRSGGRVGYVHSDYVTVGDTIQPAPAPVTRPEVTSTQPVPNSQGGHVVRRGDLMEIEGVMVQSQNQRDPFDSSGGRGSYPSGYCGPTSMQNVLAFYGVQKSRDYLALTNIGAGAMYKRDGKGSYYAPMVAMAKHLGFSGTEQVWNKSIETIRTRIQAGRPQIVAVKGTIRDVNGRGYHTGGHIMTVVGVRDNGNVIVHDSAGSGTRRELSRQNFMNIWSGFVVDIKR
jgi:hypothetical protein